MHSSLDMQPIELLQHMYKMQHNHEVYGCTKLQQFAMVEITYGRMNHATKNLELFTN